MRQIPDHLSGDVATTEIAERMDRLRGGAPRPGMVAEPDPAQSRLNWIMAFVSAYGSVDGAHHKQWVIDQVARIALGAPVTYMDGFAVVGTCAAYEQWAEDWDPGVAP